MNDRGAVGSIRIVMLEGKMSTPPDDAKGLRIAFFAGTMRPGHDGVTRVLYKMIEYLGRRGIQQVFFSPIIPEPSTDLPPMYKAPSFPFPLYKDYRVAYPGKKYIEDVLGDFDPDLIHIHTPCSLGYAAVKYGKRRKIPVVATYHTHFLSYARYYKVQALQSITWKYFRGLYNACERVFIPSLPILHELAEHGLAHLEHLPHGVDCEAFHPGFRSNEWKQRLGLEGKTVLLFAGRLVWEKDLRTLAAASEILRSMRGDMAFVLVGDGPARAELELMMPGATFLGQQSGRDLAATFASSDMLVFPSTTETFGNVIIEAMASGIVPVCAHEGGASGVVRNFETGLLAEPRDPLDLARKIAYCADHPDRRTHMAGQALTFAQEHTWDRVLAQLVDSYRDVVDAYDRPSTRRQKRAA